MNTLIRWLSRFAVAWSLAWIAFSLGCVVRSEGSANPLWHVTIILGHTVLLIVNTRTLLRQRTKEHSDEPHH